MEVNATTNAYVDQTTQNAAQAAESAPVNTNPAAEGSPANPNPAAENTETVDSNEAAVYERSRPERYVPDRKRISELMEEANRATEMLRQLVERLISKQGITSDQAFGVLAGGSGYEFEVDEATMQRAQEEIAEDGYYGVRQTSERILDFAKALSGGDPSRIEMLREAFVKGFEEAERVWGGKLPDISYETYDAVMQGFDEWANSENAAASGLLAE